MSDHISGPRALADPIADITDLYAFPSPERPQRLVLVMNTLPFAEPSALCSAGLISRFRPRSLPRTPRNGTPAGFVADGQEIVIDCVFSPPPAGDVPAGLTQEGTCTLSTGDSADFRVGDLEGGSGTTVRAFAGLRWDPFIMDAPAALRT